MTAPAAYRFDAAGLAAAFDRSFGEPVRPDPPPTEDFALLRCGQRVHAIAVADIGRLVPGVPITPCPGPMAEFRGLAGLRGMLVPVFDLAALVGDPPSAGVLLVLAHAEAVAFAADAFAGHVRAGAGEVTAEQGHAGRRILHAGGEAWPVLSIPPLLASLRARVAGAPRAAAASG
jgi:purine-binding chemotaxis protein CheW